MTDGDYWNISQIIDSPLHSHNTAGNLPAISVLCRETAKESSNDPTLILGIYHPLSALQHVNREPSSEVSETYCIYSSWVQVEMQIVWPIAIMGLFPKTSE